MFWFMQQRHSIDAYIWHCNVSAIFKGTRAFELFMLRATKITLSNGHEMDEKDILLTEEGISVISEDEIIMIYHHAIQSIVFADKVSMNFMRARSLSHYFEDVGQVQDTLEEFDYAVQELHEHIQQQVKGVETDEEQSEQPENPYKE